MEMQGIWQAYIVFPALHGNVFAGRGRYFFCSIRKKDFLYDAGILKDRRELA